VLGTHAEDRVAEALVFEGEGLALGEGVAHDLALAHPAEGCDGVPLQGRVAVLVEGQVPHRGVGDEGAPLPRHGGRAVLVGGQPVDEVVDKDAAVYVKDADAPDTLLTTALGIINNEAKLESLHKNILKLALKNSAEVIADEVVKLAWGEK